MEKFYFSIPYSSDLSSLDGWSDIPGMGHEVIRCHYLLRHEKTDAGTRPGQRIGHYSSPLGIEQTIRESYEEEVDLVRQQETCVQFLIQEQCVEEFVNELRAQISLLGTISSRLMAGAKNRLQNQLTRSVQQSARSLNATTYRRTVRFETEAKIPANKSGDFYAVTSYERVTYHLYLLYVDHLRVYYRRRWNQPRRERAKLPKIDNGKHLNVFRCNIPIGTIRLWRLIPINANIIEAHEYRDFLSRTLDVELSPLSDIIDHPVETPTLRPTLYKLSNDPPFPLLRRDFDEA